jgi:hypothetical protein
MKNIKTISVILLLAVSLTVPLVIAGKPSSPGKHGRASKSHIAHLYLYEKDPTTWDIVEEGAWGKMKYNIEGSEFCFVFNGHGLEPGYEYTLIYYSDPWPGEGSICLGNGTVNEEGNVHIMGCVNTGDLPAEDDANYPKGAKMWLVLSDDIDCEAHKMVGWTPTEYLFEYQLIEFDDTDA